MTHEYFYLPSDMQEATPDDVRGVLDAIDVLLINATYTPEEVTLPGYEPKSDVHGVNAETLRHIAEKYMRRNRVSPEQLAEIGSYSGHNYTQTVGWGNCCCSRP